MDRHELEGMATPEQLAAAVNEYRGDLGPLHGPHEHPGEAVREASYKGHHIRIVTQYQIELDGVPITGHVLVTNAGRVHYHAIPNQEFASAVDLVKRIIDLSVEGVTPGPEGHGIHGHGRGG